LLKYLKEKKKQKKKKEMEWAIAHNLFIRFFEALVSKHILIENKMIKTTTFAAC